MKKNRILSILFFVIISIASFITVGQAIWVLLDKYVNNYKPEYYPVDIDEKLESVYDGEDIVVTLNKQESDYDINVNHLIADLNKEKVGWEYYSVSDERNDGTKTIEPMNKTPIDVGEYIVKFYYETLNDNPETDEVEWDKSIIRTVSHTITPKTITISEDLSPNDVVYGDRYETETKELSMNYYNNEIYDRDKEAFRSYLKTENDVTKFKVDVYSEYNTNDVNLRNVGDYDCYINLEHPNYIFEYTGENSLHISPRPVSFSFEKGTEVENFVYDNTTHTPNYTFGVVNGNPSSGLVYGETSKSITEVSFKIGQGENPEGYLPTDYYPEGHIVSLTLNENYKLADQSTELAKLIMITKRPVDIYWTTLTKEELVYDKNNNEVTPSFVSEYEDDDEAGIIPGDDLSVDTIYKLEGEEVQNQINVGNYSFEATLKGTDSHNYKVRNDTYDSDEYVANAFEVTPRPVTVNFGTNEYIKTYDALNFTPASGASFDNVVSGDTLNPVVNYFDASIIDRKEYLSGPKDAGKYIAIITLPETETAKNYKLVVVKGVIDGNEIYVDATEDSKEVEIERKSLIVTFGITQFFKVYDKEGFDIGTTTFDGLQGGETLTPIVNYYKGTGNSATAISEAPVYYNETNYETRVTMPSNDVAKNYYLAEAHDGEERSHIARTLIINRREILINYKDGQAFSKIYDKEPFEAGNDAYFSNASTNNDSKSPWVEDGLEIDVVYYNGLTKLDSAPINYSASNYAMFASAKENNQLYNYVVTNDNKEQALVINKRPVAVDWNEESVEFEYLEESTQNPSYTFAAIEGNANSGLISGDELSPSKDYFGGPTKTIYDNNEEIVLGKTANASSLNRDGEYPALLDGASAYTVKFSLDDTFTNGECANINYTISANDTSHAYYIKATPIYGALTAGNENVRQNLSSTQTYSDELEQFTHDYTYTSEPISPTGYAYKANDVNKTPLQNANLQVVVKVYDEEDNELANENHVDVGSYVAKVLTLSGKSAGSYELVGMQEGTFNIKPKVLEVTWSGEAIDSFGYNYFTYNKQEKILSYKVLGVFEKDASNVSFSSANVATALNANVDNIGNVFSSLYETKVSMSGEKAKNYCFADADLMENATKETIKGFKIYPSVIELTVANKTDYIYGNSLDYSSSSTDFSFEITSGNYYESSLSDLGTPTYSSTYVGGTTNAGDDVDISVAFDNFNKNYHISATNKGKLTVNKRPVVLAWADNQGLIYNGSQQIPSASISNRVYNDDVEAVVTYSETTGVNAGNHSVYVEANSGIQGSRSNNYIFDTRNTLHYDIDKYNIVFDGKDFVLTYGQDPDTTNTYTYLVNSNYKVHTNAITNALDIFTAAVYEDNYSRYDDIGEYTINKVSGLENDNYTVTYNPGTLTVNPKSINVSWNVGTYVYDKTPQGPSVSFVAEQIENNDASSEDKLKVVATNYGTNAGSHTAGLSFTGTKTKNYSISNPTQSYSIAKADTIISVEVTGSDSIPGISYCELYEIEVTSNSDGLVNINIINGSETVFGLENLVLTNGRLVITSDIFGIDLNPGLYKLEVTQAEEENYYGSTTTIDLIIKQALDLYIEDNQSTDYDPDNSATLEIKCDAGLPEGLEFEFTYLNVSTSETVAELKDAGTYLVTATLKENKYYEVENPSRLKVTFTIKKIASTINVADNQETTYNGKSQEPLVDWVGDGIKSVMYSKDGAAATTSKPVDAGTYTITYSITSGTNYLASEITVTYKINKASPVVSWPTLTGTYYYEGQPVSSDGTAASDVSGSWSNSGVLYGQWINGEVRNDVSYANYGYKTSSPDALASKIYVTFRQTSNNPNYLDTVSEWLDINVLPVAYNGTYYYGTIEKALLDAKDTISDSTGTEVTIGNTIYVIPGTNTTIKNDVTIESDVTLILPYEGETFENRAGTNNGVMADNVLNSDGSATYLKTHVELKENVTLYVNGTLNIGGILNDKDNLLSGQTSAEYAQITMYNNSKIQIGESSGNTTYSGKLQLYGFIKKVNASAKADVVVEKGDLYQPFVIHDYPAGNYTVGIYATSKVFPVSGFETPNIHANITCESTGTIYGYASLYTGPLSVDIKITTIDIPESYNNDVVKLVGANKALFNLSSGATFVSQYHADYNFEGKTNKYYGGMTDNRWSTGVKRTTANIGRTTITLNGNITIGELVITASVLKGKVPLASSSSLFPVSWKYTIIFNQGTFNIGNDTIKTSIKLLPGSEIIINSGATVNVNHDLVAYDTLSDTDDSDGIYPSRYPTTEVNTPASIINNGTMNVKGKFGANVQTTEDTGVLNLENATKLDCDFKEAYAYLDTGKIMNGVTGDLIGFLLSGEEFKESMLADISKMCTTEGLFSGTKVATGNILDEGVLIEDATLEKGTYYSNGDAWYKPLHVTISYNTNGGSPSIPSSELIAYQNGGYILQESDINATLLSKEHYTFGGWYIDSKCNTLAIGQEVKSSSITLYAKWIPITYNIYYIHNYIDANGNKTPVADVANTNGNIFDADNDILLSPATAEEIMFAGWYLDENCTIPVSTLMVSEHHNYLFTDGNKKAINVYSKWTANYTIEYNYGGKYPATLTDTFEDLGSDEQNVNSYIISDSKNDISNTFGISSGSLCYTDNTKQFYFVGWYLEETYETPVDISSPLTSNMFINKKLVLYAKWESKIEINQSFDDNAIDKYTCSGTYYYTYDQLNEYKVNNSDYTVGGENDTTQTVYFDGFYVGRNKLNNDLMFTEEILSTINAYTTEINVVGKWLSKKTVTYVYNLYDSKGNIAEEITTVKWYKGGTTADITFNPTISNGGKIMHWTYNNTNYSINQVTVSTLDSLGESNITLAGAVGYQVIYSGLNSKVKISVSSDDWLAAGTSFTISIEKSGLFASPPTVTITPKTGEKTSISGSKWSATSKTYTIYNSTVTITT